MPQHDSPGPLAGIRVVDLADESGAYCGQLLADLGAEIVAGGKPDDAADVCILTGTPASLAARGLDPAALAERHRQLVVAVISPFGLSGPRAEWRSSDTVAQAVGGMLFVNGHADAPPLRAMGPQAHHAAGLQAAIGVALALLARRRRGAGQVVDVSVLESVVAALEHVTGLFRERGAVATRQGTLHWSGAFRVAACRDGPVLLSHLGDWTALIEWVKSDGAAADLAEPRWTDEPLRRAEAEHVFDVLAAWAARYGVDELVEQARLRRLPFAPVLPLSQVVSHPQLWARGFFTRDATGAVSIVGPLARAYSASRSPGLRAGWRLEGPPCEAGGALPFAPARRPGLREERPAPLRAGGLSGIRVLDFTWVVAGPVATRVLADHGADVIKVERVDAADGFERGAGLFANLNRGKRSLAVDLNQPRGVDLVRRLVRMCDVVIDNFSPRVMANWGLDAEALRALDPRLIVVNLSGFGPSGPLAGAVSYGPTLQAQTGFTWHMRHPGGAPAGWGFSYSDMMSGYCAALATVAALCEREVSGLGRAVDLAQLEVMAACIGPLLEEALRGVSLPDGLGNRSPGGGAAPDGVYRCRDDAAGRERWCAIVVTGDDEWRRVAAAPGAPAWASEARFARLADRLANADALDRLVETWTREWRAEQVMATLQAAGVTAGLVADARDLAGDPQLAARGYWVSLSGSATLDGIVPRLSSTPGAVTTPAPRLGAHGAEVLRDLIGMEQSAIDQLRADGVIR